MNNLIKQVRQEQADRAEEIEKLRIRKMLIFIEGKDKAIKKLQGEKAKLEKMLEERDYSVLRQEYNGWTYTVPDYMKPSIELGRCAKIPQGIKVVTNLT